MDNTDFNPNEFHEFVHGRWQAHPSVPEMSQCLNHMTMFPSESHCVACMAEYETLHADALHEPMDSGTIFMENTEDPEPENL